MHSQELRGELNLTTSVLAICLTDRYDEAEKPEYNKCLLEALNTAFMTGHTFTIAPPGIKCGGAYVGTGLVDGLPNIPGGFGNFLSNGAGEGYPEGERLRCDVKTAEQMVLNLPQDVLDGHKYVRVTPVEQLSGIELVRSVTFLVNADQLSALVNLFNYRKTVVDSVIAPSCSGCASIFRLPLAESYKEQPRAIIGNTDIFSRPHFAADQMTFSISWQDYQQMLNDADTSFFAYEKWKDLRERMARYKSY